MRFHAELTDDNGQVLATVHRDTDAKSCSVTFHDGPDAELANLAYGVSEAADGIPQSQIKDLFDVVKRQTEQINQLREQVRQLGWQLVAIDHSGPLSERLFHPDCVAN